MEADAKAAYGGGIKKVDPKRQTYGKKEEDERVGIAAKIMDQVNRVTAQENKSPASSHSRFSSLPKDRQERIEQVKNLTNPFLSAVPSNSQQSTTNAARPSQINPK